MKRFLFLAFLPVLALIGYSLRTERHVKEFYLNWIDEKDTPARWHCVLVDKFEPGCENLGYNEDLKTKAFLAWFHIASKNKLYDFTTRRPWRIEDCVAYVRAWNEIAKDRQICFFAEKHQDEGDTPNTTSWTINKLLSSRGRWSYFEEK